MAIGKQRSEWGQTAQISYWLYQVYRTQFTKPPKQLDPAEFNPFGQDEKPKSMPWGMLKGYFQAKQKQQQKK